MINIARPFKYLTLEDRLNIERWRSEGKEQLEIARLLGVNRATVYKELQRGRLDEIDKFFNPGYSAEVGQRRFREAIARRGLRKKVG
ncbi:hypothetical protein FACS1894217_05690 [Clostridia bacterium]|nr:hypothetical protein FACS1894217_05690 [Clostridia bacterium]